MIRGIARAERISIGNRWRNVTDETVNGMLESERTKRFLIRDQQVLLLVKNIHKAWEYDLEVKVNQD